MADAETRYAVTVDGVHIAYQARGAGPDDLVFITGFAACFEVEMEFVRYRRFVEALAERWRVIQFDKRGSGLSDRQNTPDLEMRADDLRAVLDAVGSKSAILVGVSEAGALAAFFAASHPERVTALVPLDAWARAAWAPDYPFGMTKEAFEEDCRRLSAGWGTREYARAWAEVEMPTLASDEAFVEWAARSMRYAASPGTVMEFQHAWYATDVRAVLSAIQAPTLVLATEGITGWFGDPPAMTRHLADNIPGAVFRTVPGDDIGPMRADPKPVVEAITAFMESHRLEQADFDRVLATVLFTDIIGSTERAAEMGDRPWKELLERHHQVVRALLRRYRGVEVSTAGDGFFATFDGPARAVRCAQAIVAAVHPLGIEIRAGVHTGEIQYMGDNVGGMAVHIGARVGAMAGPSEVVVSSTVHDLVVGSGLTFADHGVHELKGVPGQWHLYAAGGSP